MKKNLIGLALFLVILPFVSSMQDFTYHINQTENMSLLSLDYAQDFNTIDPWFRYGDYSQDSCFDGNLEDGETITLTILTLNLDCDEFSFYNFIKYIREKNFEMVLGNQLSSPELASAYVLANFFNITTIKQDSDYSSANEVNNSFIIGNSNQNTLTNELIGPWNYSSGEAIARFIVNNSKVSIIIAGTNPADTIKIINEIIQKTNYYESFTEDCIVLEGCDYICYPGDLDCDGTTTGTEIFYSLIGYYNQEISSLNLNIGIKKWIGQV